MQPSIVGTWLISAILPIEMKIGRCQVISLNETILLYNDIVSCALFVLFYPMPSAPVFIAIYKKEEMAYGTLNLVSS